MKQTNNYLCFFQAIASFLVIYIHASVPFKGSFFLMGIARMAVPFYFLISGYFSFSNEEKKMVKDTKRRLHKNVKLLGMSLLLYYVLNIIVHIANNDKLTEIFVEQMQIKNIFYFFALNWTTPYIGVGHLWFLLAIIYCYCIYSLILKKQVLTKTRIINIFLLIIMFLLEFTFYFLKCIFDIHISDIWFRNVWLMGYPLFMMGNGIANYKDKIIIFYQEKKIVLYIVSVIVYCIEMILFRDNLFCYFSSIAIPILIFMETLSRPDAVAENNILVRIGKLHSKNIYIYHYLVIVILKLINVPQNGIFFITCIIILSIIGICDSVKYFVKKLRVND